MERPKLFEPTIIAFCCHWWSYAAADLSGSLRLKYAANLLVIRTMCSGRVSPHFVLKAFQKGADGVLISACHLGECHYSKGNFMTAKRVTMLQEMLKFMGVGDGRLRFEYIATSESGKLARVFSSFTEDIRALGPSPLRRKGSARG